MKTYLIHIYLFTMLLPLTTFADWHPSLIEKMENAINGEKSLIKLNEYLLTPYEPDNIEIMHLKMLKISIMYRLREYENVEKEMSEVRSMMMKDDIIYIEFMNTYF